MTFLKRLARQRRNPGSRERQIGSFRTALRGSGQKGRPKTSANETNPFPLPVAVERLKSGAMFDLAPVERVYRRLMGEDNNFGYLVGRSTSTPRMNLPQTDPKHQPSISRTWSKSGRAKRDASQNAPQLRLQPRGAKLGCLAYPRMARPDSNVLQGDCFNEYPDITTAVEQLRDCYEAGVFSEASARRGRNGVPQQANDSQSFRTLLRSVDEYGQHQGTSRGPRHGTWSKRMIVPVKDLKAVCEAANRPRVKCTRCGAPSALRFNDKASPNGGIGGDFLPGLRNGGIA